MKTPHKPLRSNGDLTRIPLNNKCHAPAKGETRFIPRGNVTFFTKTNEEPTAARKLIITAKVAAKTKAADLRDKGQKYLSQIDPSLGVWVKSN